MTNLDLMNRINEFSRLRDWDQFHTPKNISMALSVEASELMENFQWDRDADTPDQYSEKKLENIQHEMADVYIYLLKLASILNVDLDELATEKLKINEQKYPIELSKGNSKKYTEL